jgi:hypothetical protein
MKKETSFNLSEYIADGQRGRIQIENFINSVCVKVL